MKKAPLARYAFAALVGALLPMRPAEATIYHAFSCVEVGSGAGATGTVDRSSYRISKIAGTGTTTMLCPVKKEDRLGHVRYAGVSVFDSLVNADVSCSLMKRSFVGSPEWYRTVSTSGVKPYSQTLEFSLDDQSMTNENFTHAIECQLPSNVGTQVAKIFSYYVNE